MSPRGSGGGASLSVTRAGTEEHDEIVALQRASYAANRAILGREPLPLMVDYAEIFETHECWAARANDEIVGALFLEIRPEDLLIWSVAAAPESQGSGVGGRLMAVAETRARELGRDTIRLYTGQRLTERIAWYSRLGFLIERLEEMDDRVVVHMKKTPS